LHPEGVPDRTRDLSTALGHLEERVEALGPLSMPEFILLYAEVRKSAWKLQRQLDRQGAIYLRHTDPMYKTIEDNIDSIEDWFAEIRDRIKADIDPYLTKRLKLKRSTRERTSDEIEALKDEIGILYELAANWKPFEEKQKSYLTYFRSRYP